MATSSGPKVVGIVDEESGTVSIGVVHDGQFLPVAQKDLAGAKSLGYDAKGEPTEGDDSEGEG